MSSIGASTLIIFNEQVNKIVSKRCRWKKANSKIKWKWNGIKDQTGKMALAIFNENLN